MLTSATGNKPSRSAGLSTGFTLVELLIVMAIAALVAAVALPSLRSSPAVELKTAAQTVAAALRQTRVDAMSQGKTRALIVDTEARTLQPEAQDSHRTLDNDLGITLDTAEKEMLSDTRGGIRFWPDGSATGGRVTLAKSQLRIRIDVEWLTGRIRISELEGG